VIIYVDTKHRIRRKMVHIRKYKERVCKAFCWTEGDLPVMHFNEITGLVEEVENLRGNAYGLRNALRYKKRRRIEDAEQ